MSVSLNLMTKIEGHIANRAAEVIEQSLKTLLPEVKANVCLTICDNNYIESLNTSYRNKKAATDVLSFPLLESEKPGKPIINATDIELESQEVQLGDIIISYEKAKEQAKEFGHTVERELCYLSVHSVLHLLGYDHIDEYDKKLMRLKEEELLTSMDILR